MQTTNETSFEEPFNYLEYYKKVSGFEQDNLPHPLDRIEYRKNNSLICFFRSVPITSNDLVNEYLQSFFLPVVSEKFFPNIALFTSREKYDRNLQTAMKPGKAVKFIFPSLAPQEVDYWVDKYKELYYPQNFTIEIRDGQKDFKRIYASEAAPNQNPNCGKNLSTSCMRGSFDELPYHPSEAFASGDFEIAAVWLEDKLAARTVVAKKNKTYAPIYTVSIPAYNFLTEHLSSLDYKEGVVGDWKGFKLLKLEGRDDYTYVGPYLDLQNGDLANNGMFFTIDEGNIETPNQYGVIGSGHQCCRCEGFVSEEYVYYYCDEAYCEECYSEYVHHCERCEDECNEVTSVFILSHRNNCGREEFWCSCCRDDRSIYCQNEGEYWSEDDVTQVENTPLYLPTHLVEGSDQYRFCDINNHLYLVSDMREYVDENEQEGTASLEALEEGRYTEIEDGSFVHNDVLNKDQLKLFDEEEAA